MSIWIKKKKNRATLVDPRSASLPRTPRKAAKKNSNSSTAASKADLIARVQQDSAAFASLTHSNSVPALNNDEESVYFQSMMRYFSLRQPTSLSAGHLVVKAKTEYQGSDNENEDISNRIVQPMSLMPEWSCGPSNGEMVSRRKILSRSTDELNMNDPVPGQQEPDEEDVWYNKEKLYKEHIQEVLNKWESIDDEIWAKIIVLERNRRVAKAYARAPVLTVNGSDDGFDGFRIGLAGFDNPMRDPKTEEVKRHIGQGCKIKMDDSGNILVKRIAKSNVYVKNTAEENAIANEILKLPGGALEPEKPVKLFDMKKFQQNVSRELKRAYPDRKKLECQCISAVAFVKNESDVLESPCWIMLINVVAMDMLKSKIPPVKNPRSAIDIRNRPRIPIPDEDPYSIAGSGSSGSSGNGNRERSRDKPPKLPPRDNGIYGTTHPKVRMLDDIYGTRPDYEHMDEQRFRQQLEARNKQQSKRGEKKGDDPYYAGLRARIPNFAKSKAQKEKEASKYAPNPAMAGGPMHPMMWGGPPPRGYLDNVPHHANLNNGYTFRSRPFERNPTTWVPSAPMRSATSEWESYWQKEN